MKNQDDFLIAHIEHSKARFTNGEEMGIEYKNQIDAWAKMEAHFRHQMRSPRKFTKKSKHDLMPFVYSFREKIE